MPQTSLPDDQGAPPGAANYIASLSGNLADLARGHGLETLAFLLDMVKLEAEHLDDSGDAV